MSTLYSSPQCSPKFPSFSNEGKSSLSFSVFPTGLQIYALPDHSHSTTACSQQKQAEGRAPSPSNGPHQPEMLLRKLWMCTGAGQEAFPAPPPPARTGQQMRKGGSTSWEWALPACAVTKWVTLTTGSWPWHLVSTWSQDHGCNSTEYAMCMKPWSCPTQHCWLLKALNGILGWLAIPCRCQLAKLLLYLAFMLLPCPISLPLICQSIYICLDLDKCSCTQVPLN